MEGVTAGDIMVPLDNYPHIPYWFTLRQAIAEMESSPITKDGQTTMARMILVFDEKYRLLGLVRRRDILRGLEPAYMLDSPHAKREYFKLDVDENLGEMLSDQGYEKIRQNAETAISEVMQPILGSVNAEDSLLKLIKEMVMHDYHMLPVLKDGSVAGVVRTVDVLREVAKVIL
ncbi:CBS domain-containing protein [bacterium]|nr:CBS domain-containing protein [bacterium]